MSTAATVPTWVYESVDYDPFAGGELELVVPTTESQREIWLADQLGPEASMSFNLSVSLRLHGALQVECLRAALQQLVDRHDALRANVVPGGLELCIRQPGPFSFPVSDLTGLSERSRETAVAVHARRSVETPFALATDPLFRAELLKLGAEDHVLLLTAHHIICDGWSWWVLVRELGALYSAQAGGAGIAIADAPSFADHALCTIGPQAGQAREADEAYWLSRFPGTIPVLELPTDHRRPSLRSFASSREDLVLDEALLDALRRSGSQQGASLFAILLGGFSVLLSRLTGQTDVVVGIPAAGQPLAGQDQLVGHCVNTLPLRFDIDGSQSFAGVTAIAQETLLDALEHQRYTLGTLLGKLRVPRDPARIPLVSVLFNLDQALDRENDAFRGLSMQFVSNPRSFETFELFINAVQARGALRLECQYNSDLFDGATVRRWLEAFETLLRAAVESEAAPISSLPLVSAVARGELERLQPEPTPYDATCRMHELFERQADITPDNTAIHAGTRQVTYAQLELRANRIARVLRDSGVGEGALVGLSLDRSPDMVAAMLGILKAGAGYVPLDPGFPRERLSYMATDAGLRMLVTTARHAERFDASDTPLLLLDKEAARIDAADATRGRAGPEASASSEGAAYVIYTSGTTGRPKGVIVPHRAVSNFITAMKAETGIQSHDRLLAITTLSFDIAVLELILPLAVGACVVLASEATTSDGRALRKVIESCGVTVMQGTPSSWRLLLDAGWTGAPGFKALCGGEPMARDLAAALLPRCGTLWNVYGPTETTVWSTSARILAPDSHGSPDVHIGRPIANTSVWILDPHGALCPMGVPGEICIGGHGVTKGYLHRPELTAARFVADRHSARGFAIPGRGPASLLYRTGDRGRWRADGNLEHLGRLDSQVKVRGYRIELEEIEANLLALPGVSRSLVTVRDNHVDDRRLVAYLVMDPGMPLDEGDLRARLRDVLPAYMVPQHFVSLEALPLLPNGKVDRNTLPAPTTQVQSTKRSEVDTQEDADPRVRYLAGVWSEMLGVPAHRDDNFFELGGHSMMAVQMAAKVERDTGIRIRLLRLGAETLGQLAADLPWPQANLPERSGVGERISSGLKRLLGLSAGKPA